MYNRILFFLFCLSIAACVPQKKYQEEVSNNNRLEVEMDSLRQALRESKRLSYDLQRSEADLKQTQENLKTCRTELGALRGNYRSLENDYNEILKQNTDLLSTSSSEISDLTGQLSQTRMQLDQKERRLRDLELSLQLKEERVNTADSIVRAAEVRLAEAQRQFEESQTNLNQLSSEFASYQAKLEGMKRLLDAKDASLFDLRKRVNEALLGFSDEDLTISERDGRIYVSLSQNLLFASGSTSVDARGRDAIRRLAQVLSRNNDIEVLVEGHTDKDGSAALNWDLSVKRATQVVKVMTAAGLDPSRVTAAGRSFFDPIAPNNTAANKAKNRRVEIILTPNLDELYRVINE